MSHPYADGRTADGRPADGRPEPAPLQPVVPEDRAADGRRSAAADEPPTDLRSAFERRLHSFGLGAQQRTLLGPTVFADDLEPGTR